MAIALLSYGVAGNLLNGILAFRAVQPLIRSRASKGRRNFAEAIAVETVVERFLEGGAGDSDVHEEKNMTHLANLRSNTSGAESDVELHKAVISFDTEAHDEEKIERPYIFTGAIHHSHAR